MKTFLSVVSLFLFLFSTTKAQEAIGPIATDRPDQTESSSLVPKGYFQWETGFLYEHANSAEQNYSYNTSLLKYGLFDSFELRLIVEYNRSRVALTGSEIDDQGLAPIAIGSKIAITQENGWIPEIALLSHLTLPNTGLKAFQTNFLAPDFRFLISKTLTETLSIGLNLGASWDGQTPNATREYTLALANGFTERFGGFIEVYGFATEGSQPDHRLDGGFTYLIQNNMQLDISAGLGLSDISPEYFLSAGFSLRLPN
ncbi:transporter [Cytophagales bacterium LB-30]|uniref:Transporter n=1 Tax=Shiella aurantiaca TaxID=3058365 RepID=A0ABT8F247_9BACT|nr:transporter [Shiella aurantiaca]MDN4164521.1 transporter [Shiella aurantiaca]